jgi:hypothetical protein
MRFMVGDRVVLRNGRTATYGGGRAEGLTVDGLVTVTIDPRGSAIIVREDDIVAEPAMRVDLAEQDRQARRADPIARRRDELLRRVFRVEVLT